MYFNVKAFSSSFLLATLLGGCAVTPYNEEEKYQPLQEKPTQLVVERSDTYVREVTPEEAIFGRKINFSGRVALIDAIRTQLDDVNIIPGDENVLLNQQVSVFAQDMYLKDYFRYLESVTGYDIEYSAGVVTVRSFVRKEWNVAAFASNRKVKLKVGSTFNTESTTTRADGATSSSGGNDNKIESTYNDDEWSILVDGARDILNITGKKAKDSPEQLNPYVQAIRSVGTISVGGQASRVNALDEFISNLITRGQRQVNINVQAYDVTLNDDRGAGSTGLNWR